MKTGKPASQKKAAVGRSRGARLAEKLRAEGNRLSDSEREQAGKEFLKLFYGGATHPATTRRR